MSKRRRAAPTPEELRLWQQVTQSVAPLGRRPSPGPIREEKEETAPTRPAHAVAKPPPAGQPPALSPIDRRTVSRLTRGTVAVDARIDLHGLTQAAAHGRLIRFLREAQADGARMALVITGKGRPAGQADAAGEERGVLRRAVPMWLASAEMRPFVVGFGEAGPAHGGAGALYVRIRRGRPGAH
jgi:DNA-nicking Smr family endonuclease